MVFERFKRGSAEGSSRVSSGNKAAALLLVGAIGGGAASYEFDKWRDSDAAAEAQANCEASLDPQNVRVLKEVTVDRVQARAIINLALNPLAVAHSDSSELNGTGYADIQAALDTDERRIVQIVVPFDENEPYPNLKRLTGDAGQIGALMGPQIARGHDPMVTITTEPAEQSYPEAPMTVVIGEQHC